jgi:hypothetical protein
MVRVSETCSTLSRDIQVLFVLDGEFRLFVLTETTFAFFKHTSGLRAGMFYFHLNNFGFLNAEVFLTFILPM